MHVQLRFVLDTPPDAAWRALRSPTVMRELYAPLLEVDGDGAPPALWGDARAELRLRGAGIVPLGSQLVDLRYDEERHPGVRVLRDVGSPVSGPLTALLGWSHRMAVSAVPGHASKTLYRDRLEFSGPAAPLFWYPLWAIWQWRGSRLRDLAPSWAFDPELQADAENRVD